MTKSLKDKASPAEVAAELAQLTTSYLVDRYVNSGSYSTVCAGMDSEGHPIAVKRIYRAFSDGRLLTIFNDSFLGKRILRELMLLSHFSHPNILSLQDFLLKEDISGHERLYIVTDLMRADLAQIINDRRIRITPDHVQYFMYQIFLALHALHKAGVMYRDLHPGNVLVNEKNDVKLCDFNLSRSLPGRDNSVSLDETWEKNDDIDGATSYVVHRWYRAPELIMQSRQSDEKIDIFSAGCVFAEMLNRRALFRGTSFYDQLDKVVTILGTPAEEDIPVGASRSAREYLASRLSNVPPPSSWTAIVPSASPKALDFISKLLVYNPKKRLSAEEALRHPYFADLFAEEDLQLSDGGVFKFDEGLNSVQKMQNEFRRLAEKYQKERDAAAQRSEPISSDDSAEEAKGSFTSKTQSGRKRYPRTPSPASAEK